jgi:hypothetical protein
MPRTVSIKIVSDLTSAVVATFSRAGSGRGHTPDLAGGSTHCPRVPAEAGGLPAHGRSGLHGRSRRARQLYLARELVVLDAAEFFVEA